MWDPFLIFFNTWIVYAQRVNSVYTVHTVKFVSQSQQMRAKTKKKKKKNAENVKQKTWTRSPNGHYVCVCVVAAVHVLHFFLRSCVLFTDQLIIWLNWNIWWRNSVIPHPHWVNTLIKIFFLVLIVGVSFFKRTTPKILTEPYGIWIEIHWIWT